MKYARISLIAALVLGVAATEGLAQSTKRLGKFGPWVAVQEGKNDTRVCFVYAHPSRQKGRYRKRGFTFVEVIHAPAEDIENDVVLIAGYTCKKNSKVRVNVDGKKFVLVTEKDTALSPGPGVDLSLVDAMKKGRRMVVRGRSSRGTRTADTYSLMGFTAAYRVASAACDVKE